MKLRPKIGFFDKCKNRFTIPVSQLKSLTGKEWFDLNYSLIGENVTNQFLISFFKDPLAIIRKLEIRYMDSKVGYGLYATEDIPKDTVIGFISGELKKFSAADVNFDPNIPGALIGSGSLSYDECGNINIIDSSKKSNHIHYVQHLPSEKMLTDLSIHFNKRKTIATSNLSEHMLTFDGYDFTYFCASREIKKDEIIGCPYQTNSQENDMRKYYFFNHRGKIIHYSDLVDSCTNPTKKLKR